MPRHLGSSKLSIKFIISFLCWSRCGHQYRLRFYSIYWLNFYFQRQCNLLLPFLLVLHLTPYIDTRTSVVALIIRHNNVAKHITNCMQRPLLFVEAPLRLSNDALVNINTFLPFLFSISSFPVAGNHLLRHHRQF